MSNPYATPESRVDSPIELSEIDEKKIKGVALGQKVIIYSILLYFVAVGISTASQTTSLLIIIPLVLWFALSLFGVFKVLANIKMHLAFKILYFVLLFIPLINLFALLGLNSRATKTLKEAGYKVGLLGAKEPKPLAA